MLTFTMTVMWRVKMDSLCLTLVTGIILSAIVIMLMGDMNRRDDDERY